MTATAESEKCGITTLFVMSCRGRAEAFARSLQSRLSSLNKEQEEQEPTETTWLASSDQIAVAQPRHNALDECHLNRVCCGEDFVEENEEDVTLVPNFHRSERVSDLKLSGSSSDETEEDRNVSDVSTSSTEYCTCLEDLSRTLTEDSFTSLESDNVNNDDDQGDCDEIKNDYHEDNTKNEDDNEDDYLSLAKENMKNEEKIFTVGEENTGYEIIHDFCDKNCDILNIHDDRKDFLSIPDDSLTNTDILNLLNTDKSCIQNGGYHEEEITPLRRCSSLRTGKTPPGTPGRKKIVRFADVLGLDLADVRTFLDEIPKIPNSAYIDLQEANLTSSGYRDALDKILIPLFTQPGGLSDFLQRVHDNKVCLENALVEDVALMSVKGTVRVLNLDYHKIVHIRYSLDGWKSFADLQCSYVVNSCDGFSDKFTFLVYANMLKVGERLEFAIRYQCRNCFYWDNNNRTTNTNLRLDVSRRSLVRACCQFNTDWPKSRKTNRYKANEQVTNHKKSPKTSNDDGTMEAEERHRHLAVQEYIAATLDRHKKIDSFQLDAKKKPNFITVFVVVIVSIVFLYVQRAVYFT